MPVKVAIVEDDSGIRESLSILINGSPTFRCIATHANAESAMQHLPHDWPDVLLMDINLPKMSGIDCAVKLKELKPDLQIIILTVYTDNDLIFKSLMAGASGYLLKQTPPSEILDAIVDVHRGGSPMTNSIARKVVQFFQQRGLKSEPENLSKREHEILGLLAKGHQYKEIADALDLSVLTVRAHIRNIYVKLHVRSRTEAVVKFLERNNQF